MSESVEVDGESFQFEAEIQKLLQIIIHSLYKNREIFLRELISNSSDALNKIRFEQLTQENIYDKAAPLKITVKFNNENKTLIISDSGIGMTMDDIKQNLGTIASSGTLGFLENLKQQQVDGKAVDENVKDLDIIGQFGVGFYSTFMVAKKVIVQSRSAQSDAKGVEWTSTGDGSYSVREIEKENRGTDVIIKLKDEDASEYLSEWKLKTIVTKYSDYVPFPIFIEDENKEVKADEEKEKEDPKPVNSQTSLWRKQSSEISDDEYEKFYQHIANAYDKPQFRIHYSVDAPIQFKTLLFFPEKMNRNLFMPEPEWGLKLYSHNVLVQEKIKELLPTHFRFIKGVVDSEDIPLNLSRDSVQVNKVLERIKKSLSRKIVSDISKMANKKPDDYKKFWLEFGIFIKEGVASDQVNKDKLTRLLRFHSTRSDSKEDFISLEDYIEKMPETQEKIYYLIGESLEVIQKSPHIEYFKENNQEVLLLPEAIDGFVMMNLREYEGKSFESIDQAVPEETKDKKDEDEKKEPTDDFGKLIKSFKDVLGEKVENVRETDRLRESPVRLVNPAGGFGSEMQRVYKAMDEKFEIPKKILEVNKNSSIIQGLTKRYTANNEDELVKLVIEQLFENALLTEGLHPQPGKIVPRLNKILEITLN